MSSVCLRTIGCKVPENMFNELQKAVADYKISRSDMIRMSVEEFLDSLREGTNSAVSNELTEAILQAHMELCPVRRSLREMGESKVNKHQ